MNRYHEMYTDRIMSIDECLQTIKSGDRVFTGLYNVEPKAILKRIHEIVGKVEDVDLWLTNEQYDYPIIRMKEAEGSITIRSGFYGRFLRKAQKTKEIHYVPNDLHRSIALTNSHRPITVFIGTASPMNEDGYLSLGPSAQLEHDALVSADRVILEVNPNNPFTYGDSLVHIRDVDGIVESDEPNYTLEEIKVTPEDEIIGEYVASLVRDGDCIQMGLGGTSTVVGMKLKDKQDLGVHTEIFGDTMLELMKEGVINNSRKSINKGKVSTAFCWGGDELYEFIHNNRDFEIRSSSYINNPAVIAQNDNMVSINTALQIDLTGQICSESIGSMQYSGTGGAFDFAYGALHAKGGRGIIALHATAKGGTLSKISPQLPIGSAVTIPRNAADFVVTEFGIARLRGRSIKERAEELIRIAHPDFRKDMEREAISLGIL